MSVRAKRRSYRDQAALVGLVWRISWSTANTSLAT
jgi:hypothetical protein